MPLLILGLVGFVLFMVLSVLWVLLSLAVALFWLALPVALLVLGVSAWRAQSRKWRTAPFFGKSGNAEFDAYRAETLQRVDEDRAHFGIFLERLRKAKDKEAFDSYMAERRGRAGHIEDMRGASA